MERIRQRRCKNASNADRSSGEKFSAVKRGFRGGFSGNREIEKQRNLPMLVSDSSPCSTGAAEEASFTLELGWRSSKEAFGPPVKKLLDDEMSKEAEIKKRSPSVIAKLMGLDGMPSPRSACKQQKCPSEDYSQRCISKKKAERRGAYYDGQMSRRSSKDEQEFKDVFEVLESSKMGQGNNSDQGSAKSKVTKSEIAFIRQKFVDAKRLSTDEKLHDSREFQDALDVLESNRDLLLKFLHQPGSLFARHLHDLQDAGSPSGRCCLSAMGSLDKRKCDYAGFQDKSERGTPRKNNSKSKYNQQDGHSSHSNSAFSNHSLKSSQILERKGELEHHPTRIVVLKPNIGKVQNASSITFPTHSLQEFSDCTKFRTVERGKKEYRGKKKSLDKEVLSGLSYRGPREVNGFTGQMRNGISTPPTDLKCSGFQGYAGDESSCSLSGNESAEESTVRMINIKNSANLNMPHRRSSRQKESSISREAKKRLTARWKLTRNSEDKGVVSRGSTLADMLAAAGHDKEVMFAHSDARITNVGFTDKFSNDEQPARRCEPLGISSNDGWKDDSSPLTGSRSLDASLIGFGSPQTMYLSSSHGTDKHLISTESKRENRKAAKNNSEQRERMLYQHSKSSKVKPEFSLPTSREGSGTSLQIQANQSGAKTNFLDDNSSKMTSTNSEASFSNAVDRSPNPQTLEDVRDAYTIMYPEAPDDLHMELSSYMSRKGNSCSGHSENFIPEEGASEESPVPLHKSVAALGSPASSKEADQPSPVSVLEPAFRDDLSSSSECSESVSADLQDLRMQLQLLKLESDSEAYAEPPMLISTDEHAGEGSTEPPDHKPPLRAKDSWEFTYLSDILTESGLNGANPDRTISPLTFDELEKKQSHRTTTTRSQRRLLFDRTNAAVLVLGRRFVDPHPWVRPAKTPIAAKWTTENGLLISLCKFLETQKMQIDSGEEMVEEWELHDLGDEIDEIGKEIEWKMVDEVLDEIFTMA